jgi:exosome complex exonuclease RRP6
MLYYARSDTHYLLYIYDHVRNDLVAASDRSNTETDYIQRALERSRELSLSRNENHTFDEITGDGSRGWYAYILKHGHLSYDNEQFSVFKALWSWRDAVARKEDENPNFVLGSNNLSEIARANPPDLKALHSLLPGTAPLAKSRLAEIWELIQKAKAEGGPSLVQFLTSAAPESLRRNGTFRPARQQATPPLIGDDITVDRLSSSQLFGNMAISSRWEQSKETTASENDQVPFPWQRFVQQVPSSDVLQAEAAGPNSQTEATSAAQEASALESTAHNVEDIDEEFTLKRGKKRKSGESDDSEDESESDGDEEMGGVESGVLSLVDEKPQKRSRSKSERKQGQKDRDAQRKQERSQRKAERRQQQQLKKQEKEKAKQQSSAMYQAVPFDYSQAASVMNASRGSGSGAPATKEPRKVFDPYAKTGDDGMKGARKAPPIRGERSATFKK